MVCFTVPQHTLMCCVWAAGANAGLGYQTSLAIAKAGGHVVLAVRNQQKGEECTLFVSATRTPSVVRIRL